MKKHHERKQLSETASPLGFSIFSSMPKRSRFGLPTRNAPLRANAEARFFVRVLVHGLVVAELQVDEIG